MTGKFLYMHDLMAQKALRIAREAHPQKYDAPFLTIVDDAVEVIRSGKLDGVSFFGSKPCFDDHEIAINFLRAA